MKKLTKAIKNDIKAVKHLINGTVLASNYDVSKTNAQARRLKRIAARIKRDFKLNNNIYFVDVKDRHNFTDSETLLGVYNSLTKEIVVFVGENEEKRVVETIIHELTHAYQDTHMNDKYRKSVFDLRMKKTTYRDCWHERHARHNASKLVDTYYSKSNRVSKVNNINNAFDVNSLYAV